MMQQASVLEGQYDQADVINAAESTALGVSHCERMKMRLNKQSFSRRYEDSHRYTRYLDGVNAQVWAA